MKNKITDKQKIEVLERVIKAIFGRQEGNIEYRNNFEDMKEIIIECDLDDTIKVIDNLDIANIQYDFYDSVIELDKKNIFGKKYESKVEITLYLETEYWRENEELKEEIKQLKKNECRCNK